MTNNLLKGMMADKCLTDIRRVRSGNQVDVQICK